MQLHRRALPLGGGPQVDHLDEHREGHREVDVALRDVRDRSPRPRASTPISSRKLSASTFTVGCSVDEAADRARRHHHDADGDDHGGTITDELVGHADRRDHRVEREDDVEQHDLADHGGKDGATRAERVPFLALQLVVNLARRLGEQEQAAADAGSDRVPRSPVGRRRVKSGAVSRTIQASENSSSDAHAPSPPAGRSRRAAILLRRPAACPPGWR